jgi:hypothetical protein
MQLSPFLAVKLDGQHEQIAAIDADRDGLLALLHQDGFEGAGVARQQEKREQGQDDLLERADRL